MAQRVFYFVELSKTDATPQALVDRGLADRLGIDATAPARTYDAIGVDAGPDGRPGVIIARASSDARLRYEPDRQVWHACPGPEGAARFSVGWYTADPPGPDDLARDDGLRGVPLRLADGKDWIVPVAQLQPQVRTWTGTAWETRRDPRHDTLWELAERLKDRFWEPINAARIAWAEAAGAAEEAQTKQAPDAKERIEAAVAAGVAMKQALDALDPAETLGVLQVNYRLGPEEVGALGLLSYDPMYGVSTDWDILDAFVTGPGIRAVRRGEKKTQDGSDSSGSE